MSWDKGADTIERLLAAGFLEQIVANTDEAEYLTAKARIHLATAAKIAADDPEIAYDALYAAARKALPQS